MASIHACKRFLFLGSLALLVLLVLAAASPLRAEVEPLPAADIEEKASLLIERMGLRDAETVWNLEMSLEALGEAAVPRIEEALENPNPAVRLACAKALYHLEAGDPDPLEALIREGREPAASMAARVLGLFGDQDEAEILAEALEYPLPASTRIACAQALASIRPGDARALNLLTDLMNSFNAEMVESAALALVELGQSELARGILETMEDEPSLRGRLAGSLLRGLSLEAALKSQHRLRGNPLDEVLEMVKRNFPDAHAIVDGKRKPVDDEFLRDAAAEGMIRSLDPFCGYMTLEQFREDRQRARGKYAGIGAFVVMREYVEPGAEPPPPWEEPQRVVTVDRPIYAPPAPAYKAGLRSGDQIVAFRDEKKEAWVSIVGWPLQRCVEHLKGPAGTEVAIRVKRHGLQGFKEVTIRRQIITVNVAMAEMLPASIGYIYLRRFDNKSASDFRKALLSLKNQGMKGLVLDLRGNPGGTMGQVLEIIEMFIDPGLLITFTRGTNEDWDKTYVSRADPLTDVPLAILIRDDSASGSEMTAGALQAHDRGVIIGETSFGKGSGQTIIPLRSVNNTRFMRLTIFKYYLPDKTSIHERGVVPDIVLKPEETESWEYDWQVHLRRAGLVEDYLDRTYPASKDALVRLTKFDGLDADAYPDFDDLFREAVRLLFEARKQWTRASSFPSFEDFFAQHDTPESRGFIRRLLRRALRDRVQDEKAEPFIQDYQEDIQLQRALFELFKALEKDLASVREYRHFAERFQ